MSLVWQVQGNNITKQISDFETEYRGKLVLKDSLDHLQDVQYLTFNINNISGCLHC